MQILLIGGTGNISTECAELLHRQGNQILVLGRGNSPVPAGYRPLRADRKDKAAMRAARADLRPDVVINFLGYELADVQLDRELFDGRVAQYIFISSASVYTKPPRELPLRETSPAGNPFWEYAQKKLACEEWLRNECQTSGFPVTIVRPSHTYSHRWVPNPVSSGSFTYATRLEQGKPVFVPDTGGSLWTLTAASDFAVGLAGLCGRTDAVGETFHITSDEAMTWSQIAAEIAAAVGAASPEIVPVPTDFICQVAPQLIGTLKGDKAHPAVFDNAKIRKFVPGFVCRKPFRQGVRESIEWLRAHSDQQNLKPELDTLIDNVVSQWRSGQHRQR
jgi:nucleoside-diphosphate-sugar epimerase